MIQLSDWNHEQKRKTVRLGGVILGALALFYAFVCTPVYIFFASDVQISNTVMPQIWDVVQDATQLAFYWSAFAFVIFLSAKHSVRESVPMIGIYAGCAFGRYFFSLIVGYLMLAGSAGFDSLGEDLLYLLIDVLLDLLQMGLVTLLITLLLRTPSNASNEDGAAPKCKKSLHFKALFDFSNAVLRCVAFAALIPAVMRLLARIRFDLFFGAPQNKIDLIWMILSYTGDICCWIIGYLIIFLIVHCLRLSHEAAEKQLRQSSNEALQKEI